METVRVSILMIAVAMVMMLAACSGPAQDILPTLDGGASEEATRALSPGAGEEVQATIEFSGTVTSIEADRWRVSGRLVTVDDAIAAASEVGVGDLVTVQADRRDDGLLQARRIMPLSDDDNGNVNGDDNSNDNSAGNANANTNSNDNANSNDDDNGNANGAANSNDNSAGNANANTNSNDNANSNDDDNGNVNGDDNANSNDDDNDNDDHNNDNDDDGDDDDDDDNDDDDD